MDSLTRKNRSWLRKTTAAEMIPLLLAQVLIALFCVPQNLNAGKSNYQKVSWESLPLFLNGEKQVTIRVSGGAVRGDVVSVQDNGVHLQRITLATDRKRYPAGSEALVPRDAVREIRFDTLHGNLRQMGILAGAIGGLLLGGTAFASEAADDGHGVSGGIVLSAAFGWLGYRLGKEADRETTVITIAD